MRNFLLAIFLICFFQAAVAYEEPNLKVDPSGFSYYLKEQLSGSKSYLVFKQKDRLGNVTKFGVAKENADDNIDAINKYLKWAEIARSKNDTLNKEITTVVAFDEVIVNMYNKYGFVTDGEIYVLRVLPGHKILGSFSPVGVDDPANANKGDHELDFNEAQAKAIVKILLDYKQGKVKNVQDSDYK